MQALMQALTPRVQVEKNVFLFGKEPNKSSLINWREPRKQNESASSSREKCEHGGEEEEDGALQDLVSSPLSVNR